MLFGIIPDCGQFNVMEHNFELKTDPKCNSSSKCTEEFHVADHNLTALDCPSLQCNGWSYLVENWHWTEKIAKEIGEERDM